MTRMIPFSLLAALTTLLQSLRVTLCSPNARFILSILLLSTFASAFTLPEPESTPIVLRHSNDTLCTDTTLEDAGYQSQMGEVDAATPVTVTITVIENSITTFTITPSTTSTSVSITSTSDTHSTRSITSTYTAINTTPSSSTSSAPIASVNPLVASALEAQRLNAEWSVLSANDGCSPGQRACIGADLAQCGTNSRWVTSVCILGPNPNVPRICAAVPPDNIPDTENETPIRLGCFEPDHVSRLFSAAGVEGGMFPPGFQNGIAKRVRGDAFLGLIIGSFVLIALV